MKYLTIFLIAIFLFYSCNKNDNGTNPGTDPNANKSNYLPLQIGNKWIYDYFDSTYKKKPVGLQIPYSNIVYKGNLILEVLSKMTLSDPFWKNGVFKIQYSINCDTLDIKDSISYAGHISLIKGFIYVGLDSLFNPYRFKDSLLLKYCQICDLSGYINETLLLEIDNMYCITDYAPSSFYPAKKEGIIVPAGTFNNSLLLSWHRSFSGERYVKNYMALKTGLVCLYEEMFFDLMYGSTVYRLVKADLKNCIIN